MGNQIFISYRREDSGYAVGRLYDRLCQRFSPECVFMDIVTIELGSDFARRIEEAVGKCEALLAVIGRDWLEIKDAENRRRLDNPQDFVRLEIETALRREDIAVIPVLVEGAQMPRAEALPASLAPLTKRNAIDVSHKGFDADVERLIKGLEAQLKTVKALPEGARPASRLKWLILRVASISLAILCASVVLTELDIILWPQLFLVPFVIALYISGELLAFSYAAKKRGDRHATQKNL
jgi:hypothetical protein